MEVEDTLQSNLEYSNNFQANSSSQSNTIENQVSNKKKSIGKNQGKKRKQSYHNDDEEFTLDQQQRKKINLKSGDNHILKRYNFRHKNKNKNMRIYGYIGCANLGSTCYFNCIIQSLFHISKFRKFIYDQKVDEEVVLITQDQGNEKFKKTFQDCFIQLTYNNTLVNPIELFEQIKYNDETIYEQNDVQEIFQRILNKLQEVISGQKNFKNQLNGMFFGEEVYTRKKYGIQDLHPQTLIQNITDISLDVFSSKNLDDAFQFYCNEEIIDEYDHPQHGVCQAVKSVKFRKLPNILIISLKRNEYSKNKNQKLHDKFEYQQTLNVKEYMEKQDDFECYEYSLFSVFVHISRQANRGHYYCYISPDGKGDTWYEFNDEHISLVENISEVFDDNFQGIKPHYKTASQLIYLKKDKIQNLIFPIKQEDIPLNLIPEEILQNGQIQNQDNQLYGKLIEMQNITSEIFDACSQINNIPSIGNYVSESQILLIVPTNKDFIITINHFDLNHIQQNNTQQQQFSQIQNEPNEVIQNQKDSWFQEATIENDKYMKQYYDKLSNQQLQNQIQRFEYKKFMQNNILCVILYHFGDLKDQQYKILDYIYVNKEKCLDDVKSLVMDCQKFLSLYPERENSLKVLEQNQEQMEKLEFKQINMNEQIKNIISEKQPFISRVDPKQRLGLNPVANKQHIVPVKSNQDVLNVLSHHKRWLSQFKQRVKQNQRNSYYQNQVQEQKEHRLRQQSLRNIQINKQKASLINMSEDIIAPEISPNQAQEILGLDENEIENYKQTYNQIQNQEDNNSVGNLGDVNDAQEQQLQKKPEWAMTEDEYNEYVEKKEDDEAEDLLDFVNNLDYENYVDDLEYTQLLGALKTRIEDLTDKNQNQQQQRQKQLKYIQDREHDNQDNQSMQSHQSRSSIASIKENITKKHRAQQDKDWDKSTTNGEKVTIEQRLVKHIADEILRNNRFLRNIHSNSSLRALLENEAQRQLKQKEVQEGQIISKIEGIENLENPELLYKNLENYDTNSKNYMYNSSFAFLDTYILPLELDQYVSQDEARFGKYLIKSLKVQDDIKLVDDINEIKQQIKQVKEEKVKSSSYDNAPYLVQKYIENPLLLKQRKFDWNCLIGIVSTDPLIVIFNNGYTIKTYENFYMKSQDPRVHFVNHESQKTSKNWQEEYNYENTYDFKWLKYKIFDQYKNFNEDQIVESEEKIKAALTYAILSVKDKLKNKKGQTQFLQATFQLDQNLDPYFIGFKSVPYLTDETDIQTQVFSDFVRDYLDAALVLNNLSYNEIIDKHKENKQFVCTLVRRGFCKILINEATRSNYINQKKWIIQKWKVPQVNQIKLQELIDNNGKKLNKIKSYYRVDKSEGPLLYNKLRKLNLQMDNDFSNQFNQDMIYRIIDIYDKDKVTGQLTLTTKPYEKYLDNKLFYKQTLDNYDKNFNPLKGIYNSSFANPEQYELDFYNLEDELLESEKEFLTKQHKGMWIMKPAELLQGVGIQLIFDISIIEKAIIHKRDQKQLTDELKMKLQQTPPQRRIYILQKYVENPLLQDGKKFDTRQFVNIVSTDPFIAIYYPGYTRKTMVDYDRFKESEFVHLGNGDIQKKLPGYQTKRQKDHNYLKNEFRDKLIKDIQGFTQQDFDLMEMKTKVSINYALLAFKKQLKPRKGDIQVFSVDMIIDENFNPYIVEWNRNPYLRPTTPEMHRLFPSIVDDWFDIGAALYSMDTKEIIARSKEDPFFFCELATDKNACKDNTLINEAAQFNLLDFIDFAPIQKPEVQVYEEKDKEEYYQKNKHLLQDSDRKIEL
ncbi:hypothetical protein PPERSA_12455 [Pseudocohnilembus persalinus]|uniref:USP domain-containing protein n=1 Tax=Pseudocohnilembus persalinus TaxID=266149 RepID=A0A0V0QPL4_PSEPJ|nr:hypothetical protein PPERSA_12455 [Pseudocohnilembus persalinus]|eukprot:KRX04008.1 hypothetical protein PPERSA_12455 [Pseudocohnilembus persalinus]